MANIAKRSRGWFRNEDSGSSQSDDKRSGRNNLSSYPASYFGPLSNFFSDMDKVFDNTIRNLGFTTMNNMSNMGMQMFRPNVDISANENAYIITAEVPGLDERDVRLEISNDGSLTLSGEKRQESGEERKNAFSCECSYGSFERVLSLPDDVDQENIEARFRNGVLTVICPRAESMRQSRRQIQINSGRNEGGRSGNANNNVSDRGQDRNPASQNPKKAA